MLSMIQIAMIVCVLVFLIGIVLGWRMSSTTKTAKIQEQQVEINKLRDKKDEEIQRLKKDLSEARSKLRSIHFSRGKEKVGSAMSGAGTAVATFAGDVKKKFWTKKEDKVETKALPMPPSKEE